MTPQGTRENTSPQLVEHELPGARKRIPKRALWLSLAAFVVAIYGAFSSPEILAGYDALSWLLILVPAYLLAYYRGWTATTRVLAAGTLLVLFLQVLAEHAFGVDVNWVFLYWVAVVLLAVGVGLALVSELLQRERRQALVLAYSDTVTGLPNRRLLEFVLAKEFAAAIRGRPLSVVYFDVDDFEKYNERHGRRAGDEALRRIGSCFDGQMRRMNMGGRFDGDEFLAVLSGEKVDGAWVFADRTREAIARLEHPTGSQLTVSVGIAAYERRMRGTVDLLQAGIAAAKRGSREGGNCVVWESSGAELAALPAELAELSEHEQEAVEAALRQQALEEAEKRHRSLFDGVPVGLYRVTPDGEILDANPALVRMFGYRDAPSLLAVKASELYTNPRDRAEWQARLEKEVLVRDFEVGLRRQDGTHFWGRDTSRAVLGRGGVIQYYEGMLEDITERKKAEEELRSANEMLKAVFDSAPVAILAFDPEGKVLSWNAGAERMFGWSEDEVLGRPLPTVPDERRDEFEELSARVLEGQSIIGREIQRQRKDGTLFQLALYTAPLYDERGSVNAVMAVLVDITERRELEARLAQSQKMEGIGQLAGGIAHDFNNLLTAILGNCEMVLSDLGAEDPLRRSVEEIRTAAHHAAVLTRQLLAFGRRQILRPRVLSLNSVVSETLEMLRRVIGENIELVMNLDPRLGSTRADPVEMGQVVVNLTVNARDAMPTGGRLRIDTRNLELDHQIASAEEKIPPGSYVTLQISDTGVGMDAGIRARLFEPFFTTKDTGKGTGLGLSTVYGIVKQSGGYIDVESELGKGTSFTVYLPRVEGEPEVDATDRAPVVTTPLKKATETVLLVEDEVALRSPMRRGLQREGYTVLEADHGQQALEICEEYAGTIHLMVTDVVMPGISGLELGERVADRRPEMKVLYTSGYTDEIASKKRAIEPGMAFLQKPYTPSQLSARIRELLDRPGDAVE